METQTVIEQNNTYNIIYSNGVASNIYIAASNLKEACKKAKAMPEVSRLTYYKVKRCYNGGVRG